MQGRNIRSYSHKAPEDDREHLRAIANWAGPLPSQAAGAAASANSRVRVAPYTEEHRQQDLQAAAALQNQKRSKRCCNQSSRSVPQLPDDYDVADAEYLTGDDPLLDDLSYEARVFPGRQPQEYAELVAQREANWAERRGRSADERLIQAASTLSLNADVVAGTLSTLQQRLDEYPQQHACCAAAAAAAATAPGLVPTVTVGGDPRSVTYVGFGVGLYGELLVPTFTCSWCGQHEVPPEALGCMPSAPKKGGTWYDVSSFVFFRPAQLAGMTFTAMATSWSAMLAHHAPGSAAVPVINPQTFEDAYVEWQVSTRAVRDPGAPAHRCEDWASVLNGMSACPGCAIVPDCTPPGKHTST